MGKRKKKPSRKYKPLYEFRINRSRRAAAHPQYVFGEKGDRFYSFGLTTHPKEEHPYSKLNANPNPSDSRKSYIQHEVFHTPKKYFGKPKNGWNFDASDMPLVRHMTKSYKKRQNRRKK